MRQKRASPVFVSEFGGAGITSPRPISSAAFPAVWRISQLYREIADYWYVVYNSETDYEWIASGDPESTVDHNADEFDRFLKMAGEENDKAHG